MHKRRAFLSLHVLLPLLVGGLMYVCWRGPDLLMFRWFEALGLEPVVGKLTELSSGVEPHLPRFIVYSLPDGLWVYSLTAFFVRIWSQTRRSVLSTIFLSLSLVLGAGSELGQLIRLVPGTFDWIDFLFYIAAAVLAFYFVSGADPKRSLNERTSRSDFTITRGPGRIPRISFR